MLSSSVAARPAAAQTRLDDSSGRSLALLVPRTDLRSHASAHSATTHAGWRALLRAASPRLLPLAHVATPAAAATATLSAGPAAGGGGGGFGGFSSGWPLNESREGFCGVTNEGVEGDCSRSGDAGSWNTRKHRVNSFEQCAARCVGCRRCAYVTYSPDNEDCSWYSSRRCSLARLGREPAFRSVRVRRAGEVLPIASATHASFSRALQVTHACASPQPRMPRTMPRTRTGSPSSHLTPRASRYIHSSVYVCTSRLL